MGKQFSFSNILMDEEISLSRLNKIVCNSNSQVGIKIKNIIMNRLLSVNSTRENKISNITDLLNCEVKDVHINKHTCDGVVIDKQTNTEVRVILSKCILSAFCKSYPMEDIRLPLILKYICATEDSSIRYSGIVYVRFYRYLATLMSEWNSICKRGM